MNLCVSNIAWSPEEDEEAYRLLRAEGVSYVELAPTRFWADLSRVNPADSNTTKDRLENSGLTIGAFQALLFGQPDFVLFDSEEKRAACSAYLKRVAELAAALGAGPMVFGSPKNRFVPPRMPETEAWETAVAFFAEIGAEAAAINVWFCIEPNPAEYGCNFLTHVSDAARLVREVGSSGIRLQIDAGELAMNNENVEEAISANREIIGHVHISQARLDSFAQPWEGHGRLAAILREVGYDGLVSIEMKRQTTGLDAVRVAIRFANDVYPC